MTNEKDPQAEWENIDHDKALDYLEVNMCNRPISQGTVDKYAEDMRTGRWRKTHQGIAFDENGNLIDGQQRLWAIAQAKVTIRMMVTRGVNRDQNEGIDGGRPRTVVDLLHFQGKAVSGTQAAIAGMLAGSAGHRRPSRIKVVEAFHKHEPAIRAVTGMFVKHVPRIGTKAVLGALVRAWYVVDRGKLRRFVEVLISGEIAGDDERVIIRLRDHLLSLPTVNGNEMVRDVYLKTERMLQAYLKGEFLTQTRSAPGELFPLPEEIDGRPEPAKIEPPQAPEAPTPSARKARIIKGGARRATS